MGKGRLSIFLAGLALGGAGMWLGLRFAPPPPGLNASPSRAPNNTRLVNAPVDTDAIRAAVREELRAELPALVLAVAAVNRSAPPPQVAGAPMKAESEAAAPAPPSEHFADAQHLVENGLARGAWSAEDRDQLRSVLPQLSAKERERLRKQLIVAANRGELKVNLVGPLF
jgi:hypothetical protein